MRVAFKTFGCRLNRADSDQFAARFAAAGWQVVARNAAADAVVVHGCAVTRAAEREAQRVARGAKQLARLAGRTEPLVVLVGCVADAGRDAPVPTGVDLRIPREQQADLVERVAAALPPLPLEASDAIAAPRRKRALLKVQDGCDFHCAYCIVPLLRGSAVSRPFDLCLAEAAAFAADGFAEIVVTGCNLGCYQDGARRLPDLVEALTRLDGEARIRLGSIEPLTVERELADLMAANTRICRQLHLPLQSGDPGLLRAMGRRYTPEAYEASLAYALARVPELGLGSDLITGLPGETPAAYARTRDLIDRWPFSNLHIFPYSERPGTRAATLAGSVATDERRRRARALIAYVTPKRQGFAARFVGRPVEALIERVNATGTGFGWSAEYLPCRVAGVSRPWIGRLARFTPVRATDGTLEGQLAGAGA